MAGTRPLNKPWRNQWLLALNFFMTKVQKYPTAQAAAAASAAHITALFDRLSAEQDRISFAVSGGSTPQLLFKELAKHAIDWATIHLFWVDERAVPPDDEQSNFHLAKEFLLDSLSYAQPPVHRIPAEMMPMQAAAAYRDDIAAYFHLEQNEIAQFDILHLGIGDDAHTASLFPFEPSIADFSSNVKALKVEKKGQWRITLMPAVLRKAKNRVVLAAGPDKAQAMFNIMNLPLDPMSYPAQMLVDAEGSTEWFLDEAAAALLD